MLGSLQRRAGSVLCHVALTLPMIIQLPRTVSARNRPKGLKRHHFWWDRTVLFRRPGGNMHNDRAGAFRHAKWHPQGLFFE
ncbi:hypothetical protein [Streptomyces sp. 891-h]|uniref:hypothetical protein n=1 Tax=Streptomyces sp. 891-h TaxID=2720714 RepID=UPI001FA975F8|nr:hypothetical protein [Streptomyces sp. 891-h]UNZ15718.1 hypothetical protein HC362_33100 [Streptomyces sp. 891-h]